MEVSPMNVQVISSKCTGVGICYSTGPNGAPAVFAENEDGTARVIQTPTTDPKVVKAQQYCCQGAIVLS
jgi:ferredoxin